MHLCKLVFVVALHAHFVIRIQDFVLVFHVFMVIFSRYNCPVTLLTLVTLVRAGNLCVGILQTFIPFRVSARGNINCTAFIVWRLYLAKGVNWENASHVLRKLQLAPYRGNILGMFV